MRTDAWTLIALSVIPTLGVSLSRASGQLIVNGSFESPAVAAGGYLNFSAGSTAITGWRVVGVDSSVVNSFAQSGIVFQAQDGSNWVDLAGVTSNSSASGVTQSVPTSIGSTYRLSFYVGSSTDHSLFFPSTVDVKIGDGPRVSFTNPNAPTDRLNWMLFSTTFSATSSSTNITFYNGSQPSNYQSALDNVSLAVVGQTCLADVAGLGGTAGADGQLTVDDVVAFLAAFFAGNNAVADIATLGGVPGHDGQLTVDDIVLFLSSFFAGCN